MSRAKRANSAIPADVLRVFHDMGLQAHQGEHYQLSQLMFDPTHAAHGPVVEYRTILTNGTGRVSGNLNAQLE